MPQLCGKIVGPVGFGRMGLTWRTKPCSQEQAFEASAPRSEMATADNFWNGTEFYGTTEYKSLVLVERYLQKYPEDADKIFLSIKGSVSPVTHETDGSVKNTRRSIDDSLSQLNGRARIDLFGFGRRNPKVPLGVTFGTIEKEVVRAERIHEAVKYTKVLENGVAAACAQYGIPLIAYSPIGREISTGQITKFEDLPEDSMMRHFPRFQPRNFEINTQLVKQVKEMAAKKGCIAAQLAINWVRTSSKRPGIPTIIPIPGATTAERVEENSKLVSLTDEEMAQIDATLAKFTPTGARYLNSIPMDT
ncbi:voltage-gated shaker-like K+ channel, subunit [Xylaria digitata]|nr:voltage-gated shaker-like K+ channel, subunit [Xylaria digitata]